MPNFKLTYMYDEVTNDKFIVITDLDGFIIHVLSLDNVSTRQCNLYDIENTL